MKESGVSASPKGFRTQRILYGRLARAAPVIVEKLSHLALNQQVGADGSTWLDRELVSDHREFSRDSRFRPGGV